jgi:hypothetical protein
MFIAVEQKFAEHPTSHNILLSCLKDYKHSAKELMAKSSPNDIDVIKLQHLFG